MPAPLKLSTGHFSGNVCNINNEPYEGMLVTFHNINVTTTPNSYGEFFVDDGTGPIQVEVEVFVAKNLKLGVMLTSITGRGLHSLTSHLNLRTSLTLELNLSIFRTHPRVNLGYTGDEVS
jgi:hypothetical protein